MTTDAPTAGRGLFVPGRTSDGHYQIELACSACHTPFGGATTEKCVACHGAELTAADSHPSSKFTDPRNADLLLKLDARRCVACHREHQPAITRAIGVTRQDDFCVTCHADVAKDRPSHTGLEFVSCASAGCHNYHDNTALYEDFLLAHAEEPRVLGRPLMPLARTTGAGSASPAGDAPPDLMSNVSALAEWQGDAHAHAGVNCSGCHQRPAPPPARWVTKPARDACARCHQEQEEGFLGGKHGMRLASGLPAMGPREARLPFKPASRTLELSCQSCHPAHRFDVVRAAVDACASCHDDGHTRAYRASPHATLWTRELEGELPAGSGVSCATCHLPRQPSNRGGATVQHNQNMNLRPNEKMLRSVCLRCHGLAFAIDALADRRLIATNFNGRPARHVSSIDMARSRLTNASR